MLSANHSNDSQISVLDQGKIDRFFLLVVSFISSIEIRTFWWGYMS